MNIDMLHNLVWKRYIRMPYGHLLDAAEPNGNAHIPTADEIRANLPNVMSYSTSIADCAFFGGLYLYGLCEKYELSPTPKLKEEIALLAQGLLLLCDVAKTDGFIARGVADDGVTHYPCSSTDQVGPWVLGLWHLTHSPAADEALKAEITPRLTRTLRGLIASGWDIPTEWEGVIMGSFAKKDWRGVAKCLFLAAVARDLDLLSAADFEALVTAKPKNGIYSRAEIVSHGFAPDMIRATNLIQFWIDVCAHLATRELTHLDPARAELYRKGLAANAAATVPFLREFENYNKLEDKSFDHNWRQLIPHAEPWQTPKEAFAESYRLNHVWPEQYNPMRNVERKTLSQAFFGAWIAVTGGDEAAAVYARDCLLEAAETVEWDKVGHSYAFAVEGALACFETRHRFHG
ncbi:MAG: hypothetical protein IJW51_07770 [Clostridia bacterium]|nr:hypothetical protein [Clostridia bacterium]